MPKHRPRVVARRARRALAKARADALVQPETVSAHRRWVSAVVALGLALVAVRTSNPVSPPDAAHTAGSGPVNEVDGSAPDRPVRVGLPPVGTAASVVLTAGSGPLSADGLPTDGLPAVALAAYQRAAAALSVTDPGCGIRVELLAAIGKVESNHARGGQVDVSGVAVAPILGPALNGNGFAAIGDTEGGALDGDPVWDRAMGPMQFIPSTWASWQADGDGDGRADPQNLFDAALSAGAYLCAGGRDLTVDSGLRAAILSYNHSTEYLQTVLAWLSHYSGRLTVRVQTHAATGPGTVIAAGAEVSVDAPAALPRPPAPQPPTTAQPPAATQPQATSQPQETSHPTTRPSPPATTTPPADLVGIVDGGLTGIVCAVQAPLLTGPLALPLLPSGECQDGAPTGLLGGILGGL